MLFSFFQQPASIAPQQKETQSRQHNYVLQANHLIGRDIRVNRGGHDSVEGTLLAIPGDYLVLLSDNVICYVNGAHVKSITEGSTTGSGSGGTGGNRSRRVHKSFITASNFQSLLGRLKHKHVQINRGGAEKLDGFLAEVSTDNALLIVDRELVRIPTFHIKNVCASQKNQNKNNNNNNNNNNNKNENKNDNKNNNKSGGGNKGNSKSGSGNKSNSKSGGSKSGGGKSGGSKSGGKNRSGGQNKNKGNGRR